MTDGLAGPPSIPESGAREQHLKTIIYTRERVCGWVVLIARPGDRWVRKAQPIALSESEKSHRLIDLNRQMMRLPMEERRRRWKEYYFRLDGLMNPPLEAAE